VSRLLLVAGTRSYVDCRWHHLPARRVRRRVPVRYPVCGTLAGSARGGCYGEASGRTWILSCDVPVGDSACSAGRVGWGGATELIPSLPEDPALR
jgi:hypothetical protein